MRKERKKGSMGPSFDSFTFSLSFFLFYNKHKSTHKTKKKRLITALVLTMHRSWRMHTTQLIHKQDTYFFSGCLSFSNVSTISTM